MVAPPSREIDVNVCVCTFRRPSLEQSLRSIAAQLGAPSFDITVADNDDAPTAEGLVRRVGAELGISIHYVHAPARNISIARNACLAAGSAGFVAFLDDDETADAGWLAALWATLSEAQADVVFGPVRAAYPQDAPAWATQADLHSVQPVVRSDGKIATGYTCNVMMRRKTIGALQFDPQFGRSGGEDTWFFHQLFSHGATLAFSPNAWVSEPTSASRLRLGWLLQRSFRAGQSHGHILSTRGGGRLSQIVSAASKAAYCGVDAALGVAAPTRWRKALVRGALHAGVIARLVGIRDLQLY
ncbi:glycosyltransferase [Caulobacter sp. S45]|uniref:glycosyltransferase family 2 protein n=1 Tax=Caulobacter sp. S45 TaxID=1641861 RepID=UPI0020B118D1|nr:glycosyltransferase [Caulobacter sp. S45]